MGVFSNATPQECYDLSGNIFTWTSSEYLPYDGSDGRENANRTNVPRILRGGSWLNAQYDGRSVARNSDNPAARSNALGFRVALASRPSHSAVLCFL